MHIYLVFAYASQSENINEKKIGRFLLKKEVTFKI